MRAIRIVPLLFLALTLTLSHGQDTPESPVAVEETQIENPPAGQLQTPVEPPLHGPPPPPRARASRNEVPRFGERVLVRTNETIRELVLLGGDAEIQGTVERDVVVIGGSLHISGTVEGDVVVIGGRVLVSGTVERDMVVVLGSALITETARIERDSVLIGGPFSVSPEAVLGGERVTIPIGDIVPRIEWFKAWLTHGLLLGRLLPFNVSWPWTLTGFFLVLYLLTLLIFPKAVKGVYVALEERPVGSIIAGLLTLILFAPLVVVLAITVIGIAVIPFLVLALLLAGVFGKVGLICFLGRSMGRAMGASFLQAPLLAFIAGALILTLTYTVPVFGIIVWFIGTLFGLGGAILALAGTFKEEEGKVPPAPVLVSTLRPAAPGVAVSGSAPSAVVPGMESSGAAAVAVGPPLVESVAALNPHDTVLLPRAGFWRRLMAAALDLILLSLLIPAVGPLFIPIAVVYFVAMWAWKGTTIGSLVLGLKIVRTDGEPVNLAVALVRSLSSLFSALVLGLGFLWAAWDREKQTWHDKIAGTVVVRMPKDFALI